MLRDLALLVRPPSLRLLGDHGLLAVFFLFPRVTFLVMFVASVLLSFLLFLLALVHLSLDPPLDPRLLVGDKTQRKGID